jgi:hypothetical protein
MGEAILSNTSTTQKQIADQENKLSFQQKSTFVQVKKRTADKTQSQ